MKLCAAARRIGTPESSRFHFQRSHTIRKPAHIGLALFLFLSTSATAFAQTLRATDYDGDGKSDLTTFRPSSGTSYVLKSSGGFSTDQIWIPGAISTDLPAPGDYDGDGKADAAYVRPSTGQWQIVKSSTNYTTTITVTCGVSGDLAVPGDYDGDGKTDDGRSCARAPA